MCAPLSERCEELSEGAAAQDATWNGSKMNAEAAADVFGADEVYQLSEVSFIICTACLVTGSQVCLHIRQKVESICCMIRRGQHTLENPLLFRIQSIRSSAGMAPRGA